MKKISLFVIVFILTFAAFLIFPQKINQQASLSAPVPSASSVLASAALSSEPAASSQAPSVSAPGQTPAKAPGSKPLADEAKEIEIIPITIEKGDFIATPNKASMDMPDIVIDEKDTCHVCWAMIENENYIFADLYDLTDYKNPVRYVRINKNTGAANYFSETGWLAQDGETLYFSAQNKNDKNFSIYKQDIHNGAVQPIAALGEKYASAGFIYGGKIYCVSEVPRGNNVLYSYDIQSGAATLIDKNVWDMTILIYKNKIYYKAYDKNKKTDCIRELDLATGDLRSFIPTDGYKINIHFIIQGKIMLGDNEGGFYLMDLKTGIAAPAMKKARRFIPYGQYVFYQTTDHKFANKSIQKQMGDLFIETGDYLEKEDIVSSAADIGKINTNIDLKALDITTGKTYLASDMKEIEQLYDKYKSFVFCGPMVTQNGIYILGYKDDGRVYLYRVEIQNGTGKLVKIIEKKIEKVSKK